MNPINILAVAAGGFFGAMLRVVVTQLLAIKYKVKSEYVLLIINAVGSFVFGIVTGDIVDIHGEFEFMLVTAGFCGAFTTFSSFAGALVDLWHTGKEAKTVIYSLFCIIAATVFYWLGFRFGEVVMLYGH